MIGITTSDINWKIDALINETGQQIDTPKGQIQFLKECEEKRKLNERRAKLFEELKKRHIERHMWSGDVEWTYCKSDPITGVHLGIGVRDPDDLIKITQGDFEVQVRGTKNALKFIDSIFVYEGNLTKGPNWHGE